MVGRNAIAQGKGSGGIRAGNVEDSAPTK